jgi:hypothetical protein
VAVADINAVFAARQRNDDASREKGRRGKDEIEDNSGHSED